MDFILVRAIFVLFFTGGAVYFSPPGIAPWLAGLAGTLIAVAAIFLETRFARLSLPRLIGLGVGLIAGLVCAALVTFVTGSFGASASPQTAHSAQMLCLLLFAWFGAVTGAHKGELLNLGAFGGVFGSEEDARHSYKILDTSVIIDGRIADVADTGFLDGVLVIPQFVLQELQTVADSSDSMKRTRGRRGLDILQRIQKMSHIQVRIVQDDFPKVREVDMKLIELANVYQCKIVTNDFNLNKVAHLRGVQVLNINELANSLKPVVLPGELMRVFILKEGKEYNQGVAYLDDGTMVVVDNARRMISKTIDISVTSVLQTTAGKMIFGKFDDRVHSAVSPAVPAAAERTERPPRQQAVGEN